MMPTIILLYDLLSTSGTQDIFSLWFIQGPMDKLWVVEYCTAPQLPRRDNAVVWSLHFSLLHIQTIGLHQCHITRLCGTTAHQGLWDPHSGEAEPEEMEGQPRLPGLHAENPKAYSIYILTPQTRRIQQCSTSVCVLILRYVILRVRALLPHAHKRDIIMLDLLTPRRSIYDLPRVCIYAMWTEQGNRGLAETGIYK